jgi:cytochrome c oxidase subunit 4
MSAHAEAHDEAHVDSPWLYVKVYVALLILTVLTVMVSTTFGLGDISHAFSLTVAMLIAAAKGTLVVLFFMHVLHDQKLIGLIVVVSLFFMGLFFSMTMFDVSARGMISDLEDNAAYRNLNNLGVVNELPEYGHGGGHHGEEAGAHGAEGEGHAAEGEAGAHGAEGQEHAAEGEGHAAEGEEAQADDGAADDEEDAERSGDNAAEEGAADEAEGSEDSSEAPEEE